jgi:hypothetical protein
MGHVAWHRQTLHKTSRSPCECTVPICRSKYRDSMLTGSRRVVKTFMSCPLVPDLSIASQLPRPFAKLPALCVRSGRRATSRTHRPQTNVGVMLGIQLRSLIARGSRPERQGRFLSWTDRLDNRLINCLVTLVQHSFHHQKGKQ